MKNTKIVLFILIYTTIIIKFSFAQDSIIPPWSSISLTGERMKPGFPFYIPETQNKFPWWPVSGGVLGAGIIVYLLLPDDKNTNSCSFQAAFENQQPHCNLPNGSISIQMIPSGLYTFHWSNAQSGASIQNVAAGNYSVTVTETASNCSKVFSTSLQNIPINIQIQLLPQNADCGNENGMISAIVSPSGLYSFQWSNGQTGPSIENIKPGLYHLTVSAGGSCTQVASTTVDQNPPTFKISSQTTPATCMDADGTASITVVPQANYKYEWSNGISLPNATGLQTGNYIVTVTLIGTNCSLQHQVVIEEQKPNFTIQIQTTAEFCNQSNGTATAVVNPSGSFGYMWSNGATSTTVSGLKAGNHQLTVTQTGTSCQLTLAFDIEHKNAEHLISIQTTAATCGLNDGNAILQIEPPGSYKILWSNTANTYSVNNLTAGTYSVTVTDVHNCSVHNEITIEESPARYITDDQTKPGNCIGDFTNIRLVLESPTPGPMNLSATGPNGNFQVKLPKSTISLNNYFKILPGHWLITVRDSNLKSSCFEEISLVVPDSSDFMSLPDSFKTLINKPISGNVLLNDTGISLKIIQHTPPSSGDFSLQESGSFTFTPKKDSTGIFSLTYKVQDTCKTIKDQIAIIQVDSTGCAFTVKFTSTDAHCGLADGILRVAVDSPGTYSYLWNTGSVGAALTNVRKGNYTVSITDELKKCTLSFSNDLSELPAAYIRNVRITQPSCQIPGEIRMEIFSSGNGPMKLLLFHPGGNAIYTIPKGNLNISTYAPIAPGEYSIAIYDESAGLDCIHEIMVTMEAPSSFEIILEGVIPPSSPSASDGTALIVASVPGALPYVVLLNNLPYSTAFDHFIEVGGLGAGSYMIQLRDANNCLSNKLTVVIPPRLYSWSLGFQTNMDPKRAIQTETPGYYRIKSLWRSGFQFCLNKSLSGIPCESLLYFSTDGHQNYLDLEQLFTFKKFNYNNIHTYLQGGFGFHYSPELMLQSKFLAQIRSDFPISTQSKIFGIIKFQNMKEQRILFQFGINFINPFNFSKWKIFKSI